MLRGSNIRISQGNTLIALCTSCKISCTTNTEDAAVKTDANHTAVSEADWDAPAITGKSWNVSVDKLLNPDGSLFTADKTVFLANNTVTISWVIGSTKFSGSAILSGDQISAQQKQNVTSNLTFTGNGALSYAAVQG